MNIKLFRAIWLSLAILILMPSQVAIADTGPKPSMEFMFRQDMAGEEVMIVSGILYECEQSTCSDAAPLEEFGPQRFYCDTESCRSTAYGFAPYHKIEIEFSDGVTRESNVFETAGFDSKYTVTVRPDDLLVESQFSLGIFPRTGTLIALCACLCLMGLIGIGLAVFLIRRRSKS